MSEARPPRRRRFPGDPAPADRVASMIRVDHAGEYGAVRIYEGQLLVLGRASTAPTIRHMREQEREHLAAFDEMVADRRVRPTLLLPLWHLAGLALGAGSALLGERAAMACTVAVEEVIDEHYARQVDERAQDEPDLARRFARFRTDEIVHRDVGLAHGASEAPAHAALTGAIKAAAKLAIWLSERI